MTNHLVFARAVLAAGVPFEVTKEPAKDGWTFLAEFDARAVAEGILKSNGTTFVYQQKNEYRLKEGISIKESLKDIFALKQKLRPQLQNDTNRGTGYSCCLCLVSYCKIRPGMESGGRAANAMTVTFKGNSYTKKVNALDVELLQDIG